MTVDETHLSGHAAVIIQLYAMPTCSTGFIRVSLKQRLTLEQLHSSSCYVFHDSWARTNSDFWLSAIEVSISTGTCTVKENLK